jgi:hypothetical protein
MAWWGIGYKPLLLQAAAIDRLFRAVEKALEMIATEPQQPISAIRVSMDQQTSAR